MGTNESDIIIKSLDVYKRTHEIKEKNTILVSCIVAYN
jgi:hypothetical protein